MSKPSHTPVPPAQGSSAWKISSHNFWMQKPVGIELVEQTAGASGSSSWRTHTQTHLLRLTPSELQCQGSNLESTSAIKGETEESGIKASRDHCPFSKPSPPRVGKLVPYLRLHQPGQQCLTQLGDHHRLCSAQIMGPPKASPDSPS